jgi:pimeloyl-ACP methyl ester carboxylesterase
MAGLMRSAMPGRAALVPIVCFTLLALLLTGCGGDSSSEPTATPEPSPTPDPSAGQLVEIGEFTGLLWGSGDYGVVLVGASSGAAASWTDQALAIAGDDMTVLALNDYSYSYVVDAIEYLRDEQGAAAVAVIGAGTGAPPAIGAGIIAPELVDQLIVISGFGEVERMGDFPKLFVATEGEAGMVRRTNNMVEDAAGDENDALILPGSVGGQAIFDSPSGPDLLAAIIERLNRFR